MNNSIPVNTSIGQIPVTIAGHGSFLPGYGCKIAPNQSVGIPLLLPNQSWETFKCDPGWYCPNFIPNDPSTLPVVCPPSNECAISRLLYEPCPAQGKYEPTLCKPGYYCPIPASMLECPEGSYCPSGSTQPIPCSVLFSNCPRGSSTQQFYGFLILFGVADIATLVFAVLMRYLKGHLKIFHFRNEILDKELDRAVQMEATHHNLSAIVKDFRESWGGSDLQMNISFHNLGVSINNGKKILDGISGTIQAKRMTAIMGPSGAGKTSLMNVLMGKVSKTEGELLINGKAADMSTFQNLVGYVPQDDVMLHEMTVRENILHSARIRLPNKWSSQKKEDHVDNTIRALHLSSVLNNYIGDENVRGISGGQRKRVNIAMELAAAPLAVFLDEPTSGLDATTSLDVTKILKSIADIGLTVVAVVHQPRIEIFRKFDDVILLVPGGKAAYIGPTDMAQDYFEALGYEFEDGSNPADTLMDILAGRGVGRWLLTPDDLAKIWEDSKNEKGEARVDKIPQQVFQAKCLFHKSAESVRSVDSEKNALFHATVQTVIQERGASFIKQLYYCFARSVVQQVRDMRGFILEIVVATLAGCLIGVAISGKIKEMVSGVYLGPYVALSPAPLDVIAVCGFLMGVTIGLAGAPAGVKVFGEEKAVFRREYFAGHNSLAYYSGKLIGTCFRQVLTAIHFTGCFMYFAKPDIDPIVMFLIVVLQFWGVYGVACMVSLLVRRENASILAVISCLVLSGLCGYGPTLTDARQHNYIFMNYISFNMWTSEAFYSSCITVYRGAFNIDFMSSSWGYTLDRVWTDLLIAFLEGVSMRILGYFLLILLRDGKYQY